MPLNYSKWDQLELSDDSDIEGHPNVDHKSLVRMMQRTIHQKRYDRNVKITTLQAQIACNKVLLPRITEIANSLTSHKGPEPTTVYFNNLISKLQANPSKDCPPGNDPNKLEHTYDGMLLSLLKMVTEKAKQRVQDAGIVGDAERQDRLEKELLDEMKMHVKQLSQTIEQDQIELETEEAEKKKKITSDDLHEGFDSKYVPPKPEPAPVPVKSFSEKKNKGKEKEKITTVEVLNPNAVEENKPTQTSSAEDEDDDEEGLPEMTPSLVEFSKIRIWEFEKSFEFIQQHRDVYVPGAPDALFIAAFKAQTDGKKTYAKQCIHQSLLLQYCEKLGKDGVGVFFKKMISGDKRALPIFKEDVERTYQHVVNRVNVNKQELSSQREQIQLVAENADTTISFNVPDGPPPENLVLEGPGTEDLDIEEVRKALQFRWDIFQGYSDELREALTKGELDGVNKVLGDMDVPEAEAVVQSLDAAGILSFAEGGIRDETGKGVEPEKSEVVQ